MIEFIGQQDILHKIDSLISESDTQRVVCIQAGGGIGKTRLLQEIVTKYQCNNSKIESLNIFDFDNDSYLSPKHVGTTIANNLEIENFRPYFYYQQHYQQMMIAGVSFAELKQFSKEIRKKFKDCFNKISANKRILLCFDTTEKLEAGKGMWQEIKGISQLRNVCVLLAGRNSHQIVK